MITFILLFFFLLLSVIFGSVAYSATSRKREYAARYRPTVSTNPTSHRSPEALQ